MKYTRSSISTEVVDDALRNYTLNPMEFVSDSVFEEGLSLYGNDNPITLYRGLNFATKEAYDLFMDNISYGYLLTKSYSSWSPSKQVASNFARTRPLIHGVHGYRKHEANIPSKKAIRENCGIPRSSFKD